MNTYTKVDGDVLDLAGLSDEEERYLAHCVAQFRANVPWRAFRELTTGPDSPLLRQTGGRVTQQVWDNPAFQAILDMEDRLGIAQGKVGASPGDRVDTDPFDDAWIPSAEAAAVKGVTLPAVHKAVKDGRLIGRHTDDGAKRLLISRNSLTRWHPNRTRQAAGKGRRG
jgi:hypothetical protein